VFLSFSCACVAASDVLSGLPESASPLSGDCDVAADVSSGLPGSELSVALLFRQTEKATIKAAHNTTTVNNNAIFLFMINYPFHIFFRGSFTR
jgi:hypothetical protein